MIEVKATDANTFVILDDELRPWNGSEGQRMFGKYFPNRDEAKEYCNSMIEEHPDVVFWIYEDNREPEKIAKQDRRDETDTFETKLRLYWTTKSIPELQSLPKDQRKAAWKYAYPKTFKRWEVWIGLLICGLCAAFGRTIGREIGSSSILGAGIGGGIGGFIFSQFVCHHSRPYLRAYLRSNAQKDPDSANAP